MSVKTFWCSVVVFAIAIVIFGDCADACSAEGWGAFLESVLLNGCPILSSLTTKKVDKLKPLSIDEEGPITSDLVRESLRCGREITRAASKRSSHLIKNGVNLAPCSPAFINFYTSSLASDEKKAAEASNEILAATKLMQLKLCSSGEVTPNTFMAFLEHQVVKLNDVTYCKPVSISCPKSKYRSVDGSCNNLAHPAWGRRTAPFTRIAKPRYADGIYAMPVAVSGRQLPNPRMLSTRLFTSHAIPSRVLTHLNVQWGQLITHDLVFQVMESTEEGGIQCCVGNGQDVLPSEWENDKCISIRVPDNDPFYSYHGIKCLNFVRAVTTPRDDCSLGHAEQMNTVTSYIDASPIYGSTKSLAKKLRTKSGGKLRTETKHDGVRGFPPVVDDKKACVLRNLSEPCYLAGDSRINQSPTLALIHTLLLREHNRLAEIFGSLNPFWSDERLYQEARRIVIAEVQHITYQEWLPLNFGENYMRYYHISPASLYSRDYSPDVNPGIINGFGAGAFRFLHTVVPDSIVTCPKSYHATYKHKLSDHFFNPSLLENSPEAFDDAVRGIVTNSADESDPYVTGEIRNLLFKTRDAWGLDLISMDIQRGRDHGLASYNDYREVCGLRRATTFQDLSGEISQDRINALQQLYECVDDIDLFVGGALERDVEGSILGYTFQCIVAEQFYRTRIGDRFFYDNSDMPHSFTTEQLTEIKKTSMARLICDNTDGVYYVQRKAFELESPYNLKYRCDDYQAIPVLDMSVWKTGLFDFD